MLIVAGLLISINMGIGVSIVAKQKGYGAAFLWFLYGFLIWPLAWIHVLVLPNKTKKAAAAAVRTVEQSRPIDFTGTLLRHDGAIEERAVLTKQGFRMILATDAGERWEENIGRVGLVFRDDGLLAVRFGPTTRLFRPDDVARAAREGGLLGWQRQCPSCLQTTPSNYSVCGHCLEQLPALAPV